MLNFVDTFSFIKKPKFICFVCVSLNSRSALKIKSLNFSLHVSTNNEEIQ